MSKAKEGSKKFYFIRKIKKDLNEDWINVLDNKGHFVLNAPLPIVRDIDLALYRGLLVNILQSRGGVTLTEAMRYTDGPAMEIWVRAVTHESWNPKDETDNYEIMEHIGDEVVNKATTWYLKDRFPLIAASGKAGKTLFSLQSAHYVSKRVLSVFADKLGLTRFIRFRPLQYRTKVKNDWSPWAPVVIDMSMREDVFEAFMCAVEEIIDTREAMGVGGAVAQRIMASILDQEVISTDPEDFKSWVSLLKELFEKRKKNADKSLPDTRNPLNQLMQGNSPKYYNYGNKRQLLLHYRPPILLPRNVLITNLESYIKDYAEEYPVKIFEADYNEEKTLTELDEELAEQAYEYLAKQYGDEFFK